MTSGADEETRRALATLASVERLTERTNALLSPAGLRDALDTASGQIRAERIAALASVDGQRVETLAYLTRERVAAVAELDRQREAMSRQVDELRRKVSADVDEVAGRVIRQAALAVALLLVLAAALTLAVIRVASRLRARSSPGLSWSYLTAAPRGAPARTAASGRPGSSARRRAPSSRPARPRCGPTRRSARSG